MTKLDVCIAVPGLPFNGNTFDTQSLGGSESSGYYVARALARLGHRVQVFCNTPERVSCADVDYLPLSMFQQVVEFTPHDVCIVQRAPEMYSSRCQARFSALWCHDLAMPLKADSVRGTAWNYDKLFLLSEFMKTQYKQVYGVSDDLIYVTRNGVDLEVIERSRVAAEKFPHNPLSLVYAARPERGLDVLLAEIMPRILKFEPNAKLFLAAYHNPVPEMRDFYAQCDALAARLGKSVDKLGALTKEQLYAVYHTAGQYVYPVPSGYAPAFDEVSCCTGETLIDLPRDYSKYPHGVPIRDLVGKSGFPVYCYNEEEQKITLGTVKWVAKTRRRAKIWKLPCWTQRTLPQLIL